MNYITQRFKNGYDEANGLRTALEVGTCFLLSATILGVPYYNYSLIIIPIILLVGPQNPIDCRSCRSASSSPKTTKRRLDAPPSPSSRLVAAAGGGGGDESPIGTWQLRHGKYGNQVGDLLSRSKQGSQLYYEALLDIFMYRPPMLKRKMSVFACRKLRF